MNSQNTLKEEISLYYHATKQTMYQLEATVLMKPSLPVNLKIVYYIKEATRVFKHLIDTGAGLPIFKTNKRCTTFSNRQAKNVTIHGITDEKILIIESTLIPF